MFGPVHHVGYRVDDLDAAIALFQGAFGGRLTRREAMPQRGIEIAFVQIGDSLVEFVRSLTGSNPTTIAIDHVAFQVPDIEATLALCRQRGLKLQDERPRVTSAGQKVAFLADDAVNGARVQFVQTA